MPSRFGLSHPEVAHLLEWVQGGVIARFQLRRYGASDADIARLVRRRELTVAHPGVYVTHSGPLTYPQREWVAVLAAWPSALTGESALPGHHPGIIQLAVERGRSVGVPAGVRLRRTDSLRQRLRPCSSPPRVLIEHAMIDVMADRISAGDVPGAFAALARACFGHQTSPDRILAVLETRARVSGRRTIEGLLTDLRDGACSVLERGYLHLVERAHGLPRGSRQVASTATGGLTVKDVRYDEFTTIMELNGRAFHDSPEAYDADASRDLAEQAIGGNETVRVTYGLVFRTPCRTAAWIGTILQRRGWTGSVKACPRCPQVSVRTA